MMNIGKSKVTFIPAVQGFLFVKILIQLCVFLIAGVAHSQTTYTEIDIVNDIESITGILESNSSDFVFEKEAYIDSGSVSSAQTLDGFHTRLRAHRPSALVSEEKRTWIPIAGDITIFIPKDETLYPIEKRIGDAFVQARLIRSQVFRQLGRQLILDSYQDESAQINSLYNNAYTLAGRPGFSKRFGEPLEEVDRPSDLDIIWPELRVIFNEQILVPVLYLSDSSLENGVDGHTVEFLGEQAEFADITINSGSVTTRRNALLNTMGNFTIEEGAIVNAVEGDLNLLAGGTLLNHGTISGPESVNIFAQNYIQKTKVHRFQSAYGFRDRLGRIATLNARVGDIYIESMQNIVLEGAGVDTGGSITFNASGGNILIGGVSLSREQYIRQSDNFSHLSEREYIGSTLSARDNISLMAGGHIQIIASSLHADEGHIELLANLGISIIDEENVSQSTSHFESRKLTVDENTYVTVAMRAVLDAGKGIKIHTKGGDITLRAADIRSQEGTTAMADSGKIQMLMTVENDQYNYTSVKEKTWTIKTTSRGHDQDTAVPNTIVGGFTAEALYGVEVEYEGDPELSHEAQVAELAKLPGLEWMADVRNQFPEADWQAVDTIYDQWDHSSSQLSPAAIAVITIVVAVATAGAGAGLVAAVQGTSAAAVAGSTAAVVAQAAITSLATTAAITSSTALANGENLFDATVYGTEVAFREEGLTSAATAMVTAGAVASLDVEFFTEVPGLGDGDGGLNLIGQATQAVSHATVKAGIRSYTNETSFSDEFRTVLVQDAVNNLGATVTQQIIGADLHDVARIIALAGTSCVVGAVSGDVSGGDAESGCVTSAGASVIQQLVEHGYSSETDELTEKQEELATWLEENINADIGLMSDEEIASYLNSSDFQPEALFYVNALGDARSQLQMLTLGATNTSRIISALGLLITGAEGSEISIADNIVSAQSWGDYNVNSNKIGNALIIRSILIEQQDYARLLSNGYSVEDLVRRGIIEHSDEFNYLTDHVTGEELVFLMSLDELMEEYTSETRPETAEGELSSDEIYGEIDVTNFRIIAIKEGALASLTEFRSQLNAFLANHNVVNADELNYIYNIYLRRYRDSFELYNALGAYGGAGMPQRMALDYAESVSRRLARQHARHARGLSRQAKVDRFLDRAGSAGELSLEARASLRRDLQSDPSLLRAFEENPDLLNSWKLLREVGLESGVLRDLERLKQIDDYLSLNPGAEASILSGFERVGVYTDEFLNGLKNATDNLSHLNGRSGSPEEIADAVNRIKQHRELVNEPSRGNFGYLEGTIDSKVLDESVVRSGPSDDIVEIFEAIPVNSQNEIGGANSWLRTTDSEYKMLNRFANDYGAVRGSVYPDIVGSVRIVSERPYCASCSGVIQQFNEMFPNVQLILIDGVR